MSLFSGTSGPWFNIKMSSYQYKKSHYGDKTVVRSSYLHNGISYTGKLSSLYWIRASARVNWKEKIQSKPFFYFLCHLYEWIDQILCYQSIGINWKNILLWSKNEKDPLTNITYQLPCRSSKLAQTQCCRFYRRRETAPVSVWMNSCLIPFNHILPDPNTAPCRNRHDSVWTRLYTVAIRKVGTTPISECKRKVYSSFNHHSFVTSLKLIDTHIYECDLYPIVLVKACCLFNENLLPETILPNCKFDHLKQNIIFAFWRISMVEPVHEHYLWAHHSKQQPFCAYKYVHWVYCTIKSKHHPEQRL